MQLCFGLLHTLFSLRNSFFARIRNFSAITLLLPTISPAMQANFFLLLLWLKAFFFFSEKSNMFLNTDNLGFIRYLFRRCPRRWIETLTSNFHFNVRLESQPYLSAIQYRLGPCALKIRTLLLSDTILAIFCTYVRSSVQFLMCETCTTNVEINKFQIFSMLHRPSIWFDKQKPAVW